MYPIRTFVIAAAWSLHLHAANAPESDDTLEELDRVEVYGSRPDLSKLRQAIIEAEDRFYARYNELNAKDDFDVNCRVDARTGTRLTTRTCRPRYHEDAVQEGAKQAVELRQRFQSGGGMNSPPVPAAIAIMARRPEFERNMRNVVREHPELTRLLQERAAMADALKRATDRTGGEPGEIRQTEDPSESLGILPR